MELSTNLQCEKGFSMLELMITMVIFAVVMTGVVQMFTSTSKYHTTQEMMMNVSQDIRAAKQLITYELRTAGCNPVGTTRMGFLTDADDSQNTDANSIHFTLDLNNDGDADDPNEEVAYYRTNDNCTGGAGAILAAGDNTVGCLRRNTGGGGQPVAANVTDLQFNYFDADGNPTPALTTNTLLDTVRTVQVSIWVQVQNTARVRADQQTTTNQFRIRVRNAGL